MGSGHFTATWQLPVDSLYDRFLLDARLDSLDLLSLNEIVKPLAPAEVVSGWAQDVVFHMDGLKPERTDTVRLPVPEIESGFIERERRRDHTKRFLVEIGRT